MIWLHLLRPRQWIKNLFVFLSPIFAGDLRDMTIAGMSAALFASLCLASSAIYALNDVLDAERDRQHPNKRLRPVAAGQIRPASALMAAGLLAAAALAIGFACANSAGVSVALFLALNAGYSVWFKHEVLLDVFAIAGSFMLRVVVGGTISSIRPSHWMILMCIFLTLMLALGKRRAELLTMQDAAEIHRRVLAIYRVEVVDQMLVVLITMVVASFSLFTVSDYALRRFGTDALIYTIPIVVFGLFRYLILIHTTAVGGDPTELILTDRPMFLSVVVWLLASIGVVYG